MSCGRVVAMTVDRRLLLPVVLALVLAGCTRGERPRTAATASQRPPGDLTATIVQYRRDVPRHVVQLKFSNGGRDAVEITLLDAKLPGYEAAPGGVRTTGLKAGRRVDLPAQLGAPTCDAPVSGTPSATVRVASGDGAATRMTVPVTDDGLLRRLRQHDCDVQRVEAAVDVELSDSWQKTGADADTAVRGSATASLRPGAESVRITDVIAGELLGVTVATADGDPALPVELDAGHTRADMDLEVIGTRCDGHAIAESRRLMAFSFSVSVQGAPPVVLRRSPDLAGFRTLVDALLERCGLD